MSSEVEKSMVILLAKLRELEQEGVVESGQAEKCASAVRELRHAMRVRDIRKVESSMAKLVRALSRSSRP